MVDRPYVMEERVVTGARGMGLRVLSPAYWVGLVADDVREIHRTRFVLKNLIVTQLKIRYHRSALGFFWTLLNPILLLGVQAIVFSKLMTSIPHYSVYLFAGFIPWQFVLSSIDNGSRSMLSSEGFIRKIAAPKILFPLADVVVCLINMFFAMAALFVLFQLLGARIYPQLILIPIATLLLTMFAFGLALISMSLTTFFRDFLHLIPVFLTAWYFASPIMFMADMLRGAGRSVALILQFNPLTYFLDFYQCAIYFGRWPDSTTWVVSSVLAFVTLAAGYATYKKLEHVYIFRL